MCLCKFKVLCLFSLELHKLALETNLGESITMLYMCASVLLYYTYPDVLPKEQCVEQPTTLQEICLYLFKVLPSSYPYSGVKNTAVRIGEALVVKYYRVMWTAVN